MYLALFHFFFRDAYVAIGDDSGVEPHRMCGISAQLLLLTQARRVPLFHFSDREFYGAQKGFQVYYTVLNESISEGKCATVRS